MTEVVYSSKAKRQLKKYKRNRQIPEHALVKLQTWKNTVKEFGIAHAQSLRSYYDHALKGDWKGFRSIYLDRTTWRAIYRVLKNDQEGEEQKRIIECVEIVEVNPHEY